ncbi:MAG TPA: tRNA lysidine(34) synthetase TilS [Gammaproteobacteria bacterium]|nr:tRNA lysidine(34) synthetase TilS [Gammaproteobacteria bacterium]
MDLLVKQIIEFVEAYGLKRTYWLAYSGGLDSHVLLHLFSRVRLRYPISLKIIHVNHGISANAKSWAEHCARISAELNIELIQQKIEMTKSSSLEGQLREARYALFKKLLQPDDILVTAHHQNDQAETILLQLFRGAGLPGLAAMPRIKKLGKGFHARPLLDLTREDLQSYAVYHQLNWIEDESNLNSQFTRNFLRHEVMPLLMKRWPTVTKMLARSAENCADAQQLIDNGIGALPKTLSVKKLLALSEIERRHTLRAWIVQANFLLPSAIKMQHILQDMLHAREDKMPHVAWSQAEIRRYRDNLFLSEALRVHDAAEKFEWDFRGSLMMPSIGMLQAFPVKGKGLRADLKKISVQFRQGGEVLRLPGRKHHHELKKVFQMWGVLPWLRNRVPLIYVDGVLAAVVGFHVDEEFAAGEGEAGWDVVLLNDHAFFQLRLARVFATVAKTNDI